MTIQGNTDFILNDWHVSPPQGVLSHGGETVRLEPKAMEVLVYLASHPGEVVTREALERDVWHGAVVGYDAVTNTVIKLRKALQDSAREPRFIATIPKKGYQLIARVSCPDNDLLPDAVAQASSTASANASLQRVSWPVRKLGMGIATLAGILIVGVLWFWLPVPQQPTAPATAANSPLNLLLPSIVILPFENLSDDPKQDYLADGITEDIITDLSRLANLLVIASNTSFNYKGKQVPLKKIGTDLNVVFALKGSIRQIGNTVRVNAQLVNTRTGFNTWAQRYDRKLSEIFTVQDEVTQSIVKALAIKVTNPEITRLAKNSTANLKAYDSFQEGQRLFKVNTKETNQQAREAYRKAIELDPLYGRAYGALAVTLTTDYRRGWTDTPIETMDRALVLAKKAVALDESVPQTHWALSFTYLSQKEYDKAERVAIHAIEIAPNYADGYGLLALIDAYLGRAESSLEFNGKATRLNPYYTFEYLIGYGIAHYTLGDYATAIEKLEEAQQRNENSVPVKLLLAASYIRANRKDDAEWITLQLQILSPVATISALDKTIPIAMPELKRMLLEDLRKAGLPE